MAIICQAECGWLLDHELAINNHYRRVVHDGKGYDSVEPAFSCKPELFEINEPFMMDSQFEKLQKESQVSNEGNRSVRKRKKKRKMDMNEGEQAAYDAHQRVSTIISTAYAQLVHLAKESGYFKRSANDSKMKLRDNNRKARSAAQLCGSGDNLKEYVQVMSQTSVPGSSPVNLDAGPFPFVKDLMGHQYVIPGSCSFLMSDISNLSLLEQQEMQYDVVVIDPPWVNKSVKRKKSYDTLDDSSLLSLPITSLTSSGTLIIIWVTNRCEHQKFVKDTLFPKWNVEYIGQWYWLKVTWTGVTVLELHSNHKKPYETLILGRVKPDSGRTHPTVPTSKVIISIPCSIHSRKPPLTEILIPFLSGRPKCLELFARNLLPGWTSWGNEVLRYQHVDFFNLDYDQ